MVPLRFSLCSRDACVYDSTSLAHECLFHTGLPHASVTRDMAVHDYYGTTKLVPLVFERIGPSTGRPGSELLLFHSFKSLPLA